MTIPPGLAAELALLTQALDLPDVNVEETLSRLVDDAQNAVESYLGLSVTVTTHQTTFDFTVLSEGVRAEHIRASLLVPLSAATAEATEGAQAAAADGATALASMTLILYAATPGAFIDLAADLAWVTGRGLADFRLDEHRAPSPGGADSTRLRTASAVNQALGVLIGRGATPEQAERDLAARAAAAGTDLPGAAALVLAAPRPPENGP